MKRIALALLLSSALHVPVHAAPLSAPCLENAVTPNAACNPVNTANPMPVVQGSITAGSGTAGYPPGATPVVASAQGTTAGTTATMAAVAGQFNYVCGITASVGSASTAITVSISVSIGGGTFINWSAGAPVTAVGTTGPVISQTFTPCVRSSAVNTAISITAGALGTGGVNQDANIWGYSQ